jgi:hypothetical protein
VCMFIQGGIHQSSCWVVRSMGENRHAYKARLNPFLRLQCKFMALNEMRACISSQGEDTKINEFWRSKDYIHFPTRSLIAKTSSSTENNATVSFCIKTYLSPSSKYLFLPSQFLSASSKGTRRIFPLLILGRPAFR